LCYLLGNPFQNPLTRAFASSESILPVAAVLVRDWNGKTLPEVYVYAAAYAVESWTKLKPQHEKDFSQKQVRNHIGRIDRVTHLPMVTLSVRVSRSLRNRNVWCVLKLQSFALRNCNESRAEKT
jgi:hypothetical protein